VSTGAPGARGGRRNAVPRRPRPARAPAQAARPRGRAEGGGAWRVRGPCRGRALIGGAGRGGRPAPVGCAMRRAAERARGKDWDDRSARPSGSRRRPALRGPQAVAPGGPDGAAALARTWVCRRRVGLGAGRPRRRDLPRAVGPVRAGHSAARGCPSTGSAPRVRRRPGERLGPVRTVWRRGMLWPMSELRRRTGMAQRGRVDSRRVFRPRGGRPWATLRPGSDSRLQGPRPRSLSRWRGSVWTHPAEREARRSAPLSGEAR